MGLHFNYYRLRNIFLKFIFYSFNIASSRNNSVFGRHHFLLKRSNQLQPKLYLRKNNTSPTSLNLPQSFFILIASKHSLHMITYFQQLKERIQWCLEGVGVSAVGVDSNWDVLIKIGGKRILRWVNSWEHIFLMN